MSGQTVSRHCSVSAAAATPSRTASSIGMSLQQAEDQRRVQRVAAAGEVDDVGLQGRNVAGRLAGRVAHAQLGHGHHARCRRPVAPSALAARSASLRSAAGSPVRAVASAEFGASSAGWTGRVSGAAPGQLEPVRPRRGPSSFWRCPPVVSIVSGGQIGVEDDHLGVAIRPRRA